MHPLISHHGSGLHPPAVKHYYLKTINTTTMTTFQLATAGVRFSRAIIMVRGAEGVANAINFYTNALSLHVVRHTDDFAELTCGVNNSTGGRGQDAMSSSLSTPAPAATDSQPPNQQQFRLNIKAVESEAQLSQGYGPLLSFDVDDLDSVISKCAQMGAHLDGPIQYPAHGKVAALRTPDGHMIGLYEPASL